MKARVHELYEHPLSASEIETESFRRIDAEGAPERFSREQWYILRRLIHATADFELMDAIRFSNDAIASAVEALRCGAPIYADAKMIVAGLSVARLKQAAPDYGPERLYVHVSDEDVAVEARRQRLPRAVFALRKAQSILHCGILCFGNSPVGLLEANRLIMEEGLRPALVIGMPVGFVHVVESKTELMQLDVPYIAIEGRRGGSPLAVATVHALLQLATENPQ